MRRNICEVLEERNVCVYVRVGHVSCRKVWLCGVGCVCGGRVCLCGVYVYACVYVFVCVCVYTASHFFQGTIPRTRATTPRAFYTTLH